MEERHWVMSVLLFLIAMLVMALLIMNIAHAHDADGRFKDSPLHDWFQQLGSGNGLCCDFADGFKVEDVDWDTQDGHYRVRLRGKWMTVPDEAVVKSENRYGPAVVWPICSFNGTASVTITPCGGRDANNKVQWADGVEVEKIRCFMPGAGA